MIYKVLLIVLVIVLSLLCFFLIYLLQEQELLHQRGLALYDQLPPRFQSVLFHIFLESLNHSRFVPRRALMLFKVAHLILPWSEVHNLVRRFIDLDVESLSNHAAVMQRLTSLYWRPGGRPLMVWLRSFYLFGRLAGDPTDAEILEDRRWD